MSLEGPRMLARWFQSLKQPPRRHLPGKEQVPCQMGSNRESYKHVLYLQVGPVGCLWGGVLNSP